MSNVLVIDDDPHFLEMMEIILVLEGHRPRICADPAHALDAMCDDIPDVILLDIRMPGISGWTLLEMVRNAAPNAAVIVCSAAVREVLDRQRSLEDAGIRVLLKPFTVEELIEHVQRATARAA